MSAAVSYPDPWRFQSNVEVYVLVTVLVGAYVSMVRAFGPRAVAPGTRAVTGRQVSCFVGAIAALFAATTWPIHQIGDDYLASVHIVQHMMLSYFLPPLALMATPEWLLRALVGNGRRYRVVRSITRPVVAALAFNVVAIALQVPGVVDASTTNATLHFGLHLLLVVTALIMWMPVVGPLRELQMGYGGKMAYLFLQSIVPTVPGAWLSMADGVVYQHYGRQPVRVWGLSAIDDQQLAGVIMKLGGGLFLWAIVVAMFFKWFNLEDRGPNTYRRGGTMPTAEITGTDEFPLTFADVAEAFGRSEAPREPTR